MQKSVIAIGLDAANPDLLEKWLDRGHLPNLARLRQDGAFGKLTSAIKYYRAETAWPVFLTGMLSDKTGYWTPAHYDPETYGVTDSGHEEGAYDFEEYKPFYAGLGKDFPIAIFDMPQTTMIDDLEGIQVLGWGGHARMTKSFSRPEDLYAEILEKYGENPLLDKDGFTEADPKDARRYMDGIEVGIPRKADIVIDLLKRRRWSLLLTIFGEAHSAHHYLWHKSQPHTVDTSEASPDNDPMLHAFRLMDEAVGRIVAAAPEDATIVLFSVHSTLSNTGDLGGNVFLPEMMYRWNFPGQYAIGPGDHDMGERLPKPRMSTETSWWQAVWDARYEPNKLKYTLRTRVPRKIFHKLRLEKLTGKSAKPALLHKPDLFWLPAGWYREHWPKMRAFAVPSYSDGYIRINLKGRERDGIVEPEDYERTLQEVTEMLLNVRDTRKGERLITDVYRTRNGPFDNRPNLPEADLVVLFDERECPADTVHHPDLGRVGPIPFNRSGGHTSAGFFLGKGPSIAAGTDVSGDILDIPTTLLSMMGAPVPDYMQGDLLRFGVLETPMHIRAAE